VGNILSDEMTSYLFKDKQRNYLPPTRSGVAQSVCLTTDWTTGVRSPAEAKDFRIFL
jgi:hypothetical protein